MDLAIDMDVFEEVRNVNVPRPVPRRHRNLFEDTNENTFRLHTRFSKDNFGRLLEIFE